MHNFTNKKASDPIYASFYCVTPTQLHLQAGLDQLF